MKFKSIKHLIYHYIIFRINLRNDKLCDEHITVCGIIKIVVGGFWRLINDELSQLLANNVFIYLMDAILMEWIKISGDFWQKSFYTMGRVIRGQRKGKGSIFRAVRYKNWKTQVSLYFEIFVHKIENNYVLQNQQSTVGFVFDGLCLQWWFQLFITLSW